MISPFNGQEADKDGAFADEFPHFHHMLHPRACSPAYNEPPAVLSESQQQLRIRTRRYHDLLVRQGLQRILRFLTSWPRQCRSLLAPTNHKKQGWCPELQPHAKVTVMPARLRCESGASRMFHEDFRVERPVEECCLAMFSRQGLARWW